MDEVNDTLRKKKLNSIKKSELLKLFNWIYPNASKEVKYLQFSSLNFD